MTLRVILLSAFLLACLLAAAAAINPAISGAQSGDRLAFAGALLGAAITVAGSVLAAEWLASNERKRKSATARKVLLDLLRDVRRGIDRVTKTHDNEPALPGKVNAEIINLNRKVEVLQRATQWFTPDDAAMVRAFGYIGEIDPAPMMIENLVVGDGAGRWRQVAAKLGPMRVMTNAARRELGELVPARRGFAGDGFLGKWFYVSKRGHHLE